MLYFIFCKTFIMLFDKKFIDANYWNKNKTNWYTKCKIWNIEIWRYKNYITIWNHIYDYSDFFKCDCVEVKFMWKNITFVDGVKIKWNGIKNIENYLGSKWLAKYANYIWQDISTESKKARNANNT